MKKQNAYIVYRVLSRLNEQAIEAHRFGRVDDAFAICKIIGKLEYLHFQAVSFEHSLEEAA
jgi:hypothetical protein